MQIIKKLTFIFLLALITCKSSNIKSDKLSINYQNFINICMDIWTQIDLIRAINSTAEQKEKFVSELTDKILSVYCKCDLLKPKLKLNINNYKEEITELAILVDNILENFQDIFKDVKSTEFFVSCFILNKIKSYLKTTS